MVNDLPTQRTMFIEETHTLGNHLSLLFDINFQRRPFFVSFSNVVWRRCNNELHDL
jgi:hypothetical protein